jgi:2-polyprenyl-3-methyl-5-hydroxy-6-metoxy-1,4-benzoquinol methylase
MTSGSSQTPVAPPSPSASAAPVREAAERTNAFTGERPGWGEGFEYDYGRHVAAYRHAATLVAGRRVLDAGCGEGFGTSTLAPIAAEVVGVDYSQDAVEECRRLWCGPSRPNLRFERVDLTNPGDFRERFDVVFSFQVLEHIHDSQSFLRALRERLAPGGVLVLTTPNRLRTVSENPYHVREYTADELRAELSAVFDQVTIRGVHGNDKVERFEKGRADAVQRILRLDPLGIRNLLPRSVVEFAFSRLARVVRRQAQPSGEALIVPEDFSVRDDAVDRALDLMAVCSVAAA